MQHKLLASLPVKLRLAAACITLLLLGAWLRPRTAAPLTPPEERPAPLLEQQVQRAASEFRGIEAVVARLPARGIVVQPEARGPIIAGDFGRTVAAPSPVFAVAVSESYVVTHAAALAGGRPPALTNVDGARMPTTVAAFDTATDLVLLRSPSPAAEIPIFADAIAAPGSLVVGAARSNTTNLAIPLFITSVTAHAYGVGGSTSSAPPPGLPIYNLDGGLLAVSAGDGTMWRIRYALDRLLAQAAIGALPSSIGVSFQLIGEPVAAAVGAAGLAIVDVAPGGPSDAAGLQVGDLITGIGSPSSASGGGDFIAALAALPAGTPVPLSVRRDGRGITVTVTPAYAHEMTALSPDPAPAAGPPAGRLFERDALAAVSVPGDAVVMMINGRPISSAAQAARELRRTQGTAFVLLEHRGRRFFAVIESQR